MQLFQKMKKNIRFASETLELQGTGSKHICLLTNVFYDKL